MKGVVHYELLDAITGDVIVIRMPNNGVQYCKSLVRTSENFICMNDGIWTRVRRKRKVSQRSHLMWVYRQYCEKNHRLLSFEERLRHRIIAPPEEMAISVGRLYLGLVLILKKKRNPIALSHMKLDGLGI